MKTIVFIFVFFLCLAGTRANEYFWVDGKINGKPVRLVLDTGSPGQSLWLFGPAAERLGLKFRPLESQSTGPTPYWLTEKKCTVTLRGFTWWGLPYARGQLGVFVFPSYVKTFIEMDGAVGWGNVSHRILELDATEQKFKFLHKIPNETIGWTKLALRTNWGVLAMEIPNADGTKGVIIVDTGQQSGICLSPQKWHEWKAAHLDQPTTIAGAYSPSTGLHVQEEAWTGELSLGPLTLTSVLIEEADPWGVSLAKTDYAAVLGMAALKRLDLIVDGKHGFAYLRPKKTPASPPSEYNRLGADFLPRDAQSDDLVAYVVDHSPASEAGIRNADVLLKIGERDVTKWRSKPNMPRKDPFCQPPGTKLDLTLRRGDERLETTVVLREILGRQTNSEPNEN